MCQACLEAELWLAYQEEMAAKEDLTKADLTKEGLTKERLTREDTATMPAAGAAAPAPTSLTPPEPSASPFACEEPPST